MDGIAQRPMDGVSMLYSTADAKAADRRTTQYFEMFGNRAIYHEGWVASTRHSIPWLMVPLPSVKDDVWELYNVAEDFSQAVNILSVNGAKVAEAHIPKTQPFAFSADEGADVGIDSETNVSKDYQPGLPSAFTGTIHRVTVEQK